MKSSTAVRLACVLVALSISVAGCSNDKEQASSASDTTTTTTTSTTIDPNAPKVDPAAVDKVAAETPGAEPPTTEPPAAGSAVETATAPTTTAPPPAGATRSEDKGENPGIEMAGPVMKQAENMTGFGNLLKGFETTGVATQLGGSAEVTLLAPIDESWDDIPDDQAVALISNAAEFGKVLKLHVLKGRLDASALKAKVGQCVETLDGAKLKVGAEGDRITVGGATILAADVAATNGVVHAIDSVIRTANC